MASILLVEDDDQLRSMLKELLMRSGHEVSEAPDGRQVCEMHQQQRFDLVITDLVMPDIEGLALIMELRRVDQNVRIIAMSGKRQGRAEEYLKIAQKLGAQLTLVKPFGNEEFLEAVCLALETKARSVAIVDSEYRA
jgi:DNA-binding response OmpR family regulator